MLPLKNWVTRIAREKCSRPGDDGLLRLAVGLAEGILCMELFLLNAPKRKRGRAFSLPRRSGRISEDWEILQNQRHAG
jgi:hypothetical protein